MTGVTRGAGDSTDVRAAAIYAADRARVVHSAVEAFNAMDGKYKVRNAGLASDDDGDRINAIMFDLRKRGGGRLYLPAPEPSAAGGGGYYINTPLNLANLGGLAPVHIIGDGHASAAQASLAAGTTLIGNTGSCVIDTQGSENIKLEKFRIRCPNNVPSVVKCGINAGRTVANPVGNFHRYVDLTIDMDQNNGATSRGSVGIYNIGAENMLLEQVVIFGCQPFYCSSTDDLGLPGPFGGAHNGLSMTMVTLLQCILQSQSGLGASSAVEIGAAAWNIFLHDVIMTRGGASPGLFPLHLQDGAFNVYWRRGQVEGWPGLLVMDGSADNINLDVEISLATRALIGWSANGKTLSNASIKVQQPNGTVQHLFDDAANATIRSSDIALCAGQAINAPNLTISGGTVRMDDAASTADVNGASNYKLLSPFAEGTSADRGDANVTVVVGQDRETQRFDTALTANRTFSVSGAHVYNGATFTVIRTGLGAFTLDVAGLKTIPAGTAAWVRIAYVTGIGYKLAGYGTL